MPTTSSSTSTSAPGSLTSIDRHVGHEHAYGSTKLRSLLAILLGEDVGSVGDVTIDELDDTRIAPQALLTRRHVPEKAWVTRELVGATKLRERAGVVAIAIEDLRDVVIRARLAAERLAEGSSGTGRVHGRRGRW
jgi:hypothetical protein